MKLRFGLLLLVCLAACQIRSLSDEERTLASFNQIDPFPLYEMHYYGDYGFGERLQRSQRLPAGVVAWQVSDLPGWGCTCFAALHPGSEPLLARNFDWLVHPALVLFTQPPDGYAAISLVDVSYLGLDQAYPNESQKQQLLRAPYLPFDGMNEMGLAVGMMAVPQADGGSDPARLTLDSLELMRLWLDYAATIDQALELLNGYNIDFGSGPPLHYMLVEKSGKSAVIELLDGEVLLLPNQDAWQVATNFVISQAQPQGAASGCWRYNTAYTELAALDGKLEAQSALGVLEHVSQAGDYPTIWSVVYQLESGKASVVIDRQFRQVYEFLLAR